MYGYSISISSFVLYVSVLYCIPPSCLLLNRLSTVFIEFVPDDDTTQIPWESISLVVVSLGI